MTTTQRFDDVNQYEHRAPVSGFRALMRSAGSLLDVRSAPLWRSPALDEFTGGVSAANVRSVAPW